MARISLFVLLLSFTLVAPAQKLTILHTNDLHSRMLGFSPNADYTPFITGDDSTVGGFARIATLIKEEKEAKPGEVLVLDAGDFLMGTIFHTLEAETGFQLRLMHQMGYDAISIGNHEFDMGIGILSDIIARSAISGVIPPLLLANLKFNAEDPTDDMMEALYKREVIKPFTVIERNGIKIGLFGILGYEAAMVAPYVAPASFPDPVETARKIARILKEEEKVDLIICQSHSGVMKDKKGNWAGEDVELAKQVADIDIIISSHSHTHLFEPVLVGNQLIVQAGSEGRFVGRLEIELVDGKVMLIHDELVVVDDKISGDRAIQKLIDEQKDRIGATILSTYGFQINQSLVETSFDLTFNEQGDLPSSTLGPFVADALYWYANHIDPKGVDFQLVPAGLIRDEIRRGQQGIQLPADLFRILPLGSGAHDTSPGYSMAKVFLTGSEVKTVLEVMLLAPKISTGNYGYWSGVRFSLNPLRLPLDQIYEVELGNGLDGYHKIPLTRDPDRLYSLVTNTYVLDFLGLVKEITKGIFKVQPKFEDGTLMTDFKMAVMDRDLSTPGIQEAKEWAGLLTYASQLPDLNGNGIPDIPDLYRAAASPGTATPSISPILYLKGTNGVSVIPAVLVVGVLATAGVIIF